ncbi:MAG TPA: STAS domain-containing protein [Thermoanaerobaculaceae bacterium]|nr:STAS domain-containing protein [Thermoanaerobaculaceae bacterium]
MQLHRTEEDGATVVEVVGTVKLGESADEFSRELQRTFEQAPGGVVIDFARIDYLDSTGIGELVGHLRRFTRAGRRIALFRPHHRLEALLTMTRLDSVFPIFWERDEALRFVRGEAGGG